MIIGYVDNVLVAYFLMSCVYVVLVIVCLLVLNQTDWNRQSNKVFEKQLKFAESAYSSKVISRVIDYINFSIAVVAACFCVLLAKWFLSIALGISVFVAIGIHLSGQKFKEKYKDKIKELQTKGVIKKIVPEVKAVKEDAIITRLKNVG